MPFQNRYFDVNISFGQYRQAITAFAKTWLLPYTADFVWDWADEDEDEAYLHNQAGHSTTVARTKYGRTNVDFRNLDVNGQAQFRKASYLLHDYIGASSKHWTPTQWPPAGTRELKVRD